MLGAAHALAQGTNQGGRGGPGGGAGGGFTGGGGGTGGTGTRAYQNTTMVGDAVITSDVDTRRLIVVTDETTNENIKKIIASLDKPKPQVLINVVFLQVTHGNNFDLSLCEVERVPKQLQVYQRDADGGRFDHPHKNSGFIANPGQTAGTYVKAVAQEPLASDLSRTGERYFIARSQHQRRAHIRHTAVDCRRQGRCMIMTGEQ
jgi:hypothetical protein